MANVAAVALECLLIDPLISVLFGSIESIVLFGSSLEKSIEYNTE